MAESRDLERLLAFALELAAAAEAAILPRYRNAAVSYKPDGTEVTAADREAERLMRERIAQRYPEHGVLGEEFGPGGPPNAEWVWVLDPVDGTASFTLGIPLFGTLVGLLQARRPVVGVVHLPALGETLYAARGSGCWWKRAGQAAVPVRVEPVDALDQAVVMGPTGLSSLPPPGREAAFRRLLPLLRQARKFRFGGDCLQHVLVCRGLAHLALDPAMHPWDSAAVVACVEEAGGVVAGMGGERQDVVFAGSLISGSTERLLEQALGLLESGESGARRSPPGSGSLPAPPR